jgi:hypothetical protein
MMNQQQPIFRQQLINDLSHRYEPEYLEYAITLKPKFSTWKWWAMKDEDRIAFMKELWEQIQRQLNSVLVNHWQRPCKEHLLVSGTFLMETKTKKRTDTVPHIHGLMLIHKSLVPKWIDLLERIDDGTDEFRMPTLTRGLIDIHDVEIKRPFDVRGWWKYASKELEANGDIVGFEFSGVPAR